MSYLKATHSNLSNYKILWRNNSLFIFDQKHHFQVFSTENVLFWYSWGRVFHKLYSYLKTAPSNLSICKILRKKTNMPKVGTKNAWVGYFWSGIWKQYGHIWNHHPRICQTAKFLWKGLNFGLTMPYLCIFGLEF